jgi:hypothetical protein
MKTKPVKAKTVQFDWYCDWCDKGMRKRAKSYLDSRHHAHCSQACVDDHEANR